MDRFDTIIIGAGAAGLMCAIRAGQRGRKVLVLDHAEKVGKKILISGGGRCNFTNTNTAPDRFISENPHFCKSALKRYTPADFIALVRKHNIAHHEKTLGQLFCDGSARDIVAMLMAECKSVDVDVRVDYRVSDIKKSDMFTLETNHGTFTSGSVVLATGGLSIPKMGATDFTHQIATQFGLPLTGIRPGLVPLTFCEQDLVRTLPLSGVSLDVMASYKKHHFREALLFTHRGLSGPAVLQISSYWEEGQPIEFNLLPDMPAAEFLIERKKTRAKAELKTILGEILPSRLATMLAETDHADRPIGGMTDKELIAFGGKLNKWSITPSGTEGYAKAEVTLGGVATTALSSKTMMSNDVLGLYVIGEAVDVTGWLGGYNFQWAWASGWCAGDSL